MSKLASAFLIFIICSVSYAQRNPIPKVPHRGSIPHDPTGENHPLPGNSTTPRDQSDEEIKVEKPKLIKVISGFDNPESVLIHQDSVFISDMGKDTDSLAKDGNILKFDFNGVRNNVFALEENLTSPMGMSLLNNILYVADVSKVLGFSSQTGEKVIEYDLGHFEATFLNDIAIIEDRYLVVTATKLKKVFKIDLNTGVINEMKFHLFGDAPNGIAYDQERSLVYIAANKKHTLGNFGNGSVFTFNVKGNSNNPYLLEQNSLGRFLDGISIRGNMLIVSDWFDMNLGGKLHYLDRKTLTSKVEHTMISLGLADFDYNSSSNLLVTPDLINGNVLFYRH